MVYDTAWRNGAKSDKQDKVPATFP
jgi:hypothetical protein